MFRTYTLVLLIMAIAALTGCQPRLSVSAAAPQISTANQHYLLQLSAPDGHLPLLQTLAAAVAADHPQLHTEANDQDLAILHVHLKEVAMAGKPQRILRRQSGQTGGPIGSQGEYFLARIMQATLRYQNQQSDQPMATVIGRAYVNPLPDARRQQASWWYQGQPITLSKDQPGLLTRAAITDGLKQLARQLNPSPAQPLLTIPLDTSRPALQTLLQEAAAGDHQRVAQLLRQRYQNSDRKDPVIAYNIAALLDIQGHYHEALHWYGQAIAADPKPLYHQQWQACQQRLQTHGDTQDWL